MQLRKNGIDVTIPDDQVVNLVLRALGEDERPAQSIIQASAIAPAITLELPEIGEYWPGMGGIFTGLLPGKDGAKYHALITGPLFNNAEKYEDMKKRVEAVEVDGHNDFRLPTRSEQALQHATLKDKFSKEDWYWSNEPHPVYDYGAYAQYFVDGYQGSWHTNDTCYGCAVRIVPIR